MRLGEKNLLALPLALLPSIAFAAEDLGKTVRDRFGNFGKAVGFQTEDNPTLAALIGSYISIFLGFLGVIFLILAIYAGYLWLTAGGNEEQVTKAKDYLRNAVIGIIIVASAYLITSFVVTNFSQTQTS